MDFVSIVENLKRIQSSSLARTAPPEDYSNTCLFGSSGTAIVVRGLGAHAVAELDDERAGVHCCECGGTQHRSEIDEEGYSRAVPCAGADVDRKIHLFNGAGIPARFAGSTFERWQSCQADSVLHSVKQWLAKYPQQRRGLWLFGPRGSGKTHLLCALARVMLLDKGVRVAFQTQSGLLRSIKSTFYKRDQSTEDAILNLITAPVLILDDVTSTPTDWQSGVLDDLISRRYERESAITFVSSNFAPGDAVDDDRVERGVSRLRAMAQPVPVMAGDYRAKQ